MNRDIANKVVIITGATDGMGLETARELARHNPRLVLVGRNAEKGLRVVDSLKKESGNKDIEFFAADLSSQADIRDFVKKFKARYARLDILINNAGAYFPKKLISADGLEMTFALNHLGYFLLTNLLLDYLTKSAPSRVISVSSMAHSNARFDIDNLNSDDKYSPWNAYATSKLENLYFTYELADRLKGSGVTVNAVHPGLVNSQFGKQGGGLFLVIFRLMQKFSGKTPANGAKTSIYLALSNEVEGVSGAYFADEKRSESSKKSHDKVISKKLWDVSESLTKLR
jgi:NAD(P)-dependent dehydrogenase (short-subunit alcohol dehydrogenase family)